MYIYGNTNKVVVVVVTVVDVALCSTLCIDITKNQTSLLAAQCCEFLKYIAIPRYFSIAINILYSRFQWMLNLYCSPTIEDPLHIVVACLSNWIQPLNYIRSGRNGAKIRRPICD